MRKKYLPKPTDTSAANDLRRVLNAVPLEIHLARSSEHFDCLQLAEPELVFAGNQRCVDPRTGVAAYGPYWKTLATKRPQLFVGIVGTVEGIENTLKRLEEISKPIEQESNIDCMLHPSFPGLNSGPPFEVDLITQPLWHRTLSPQDLRRLEQYYDATARAEYLQTCFSGEVRSLSAIESPPHVVICAASEPMQRLMDPGTAADGSKNGEQDEIFANDSESKSFRIMERFTCGLKAACMGFLPTEVYWHNTRTGRVRDRATEAWNLSVTLLYKAGLVPWQLADPAEDTCYVGISSCSSAGSTLPYSRTMFAQMFTELGQEFVVKAETCEWNPDAETDRTPHLTKDEATKLASRVLEIYEAERGRLPRKVVIHKTSRYSGAERLGFENVLSKICSYGLVTITKRGIFCVRPGRKPVPRGTAIQFGEKLGLVYTSGYVPFLGCHTGPRLPQPLEIIENWGSLPFQEVAEDLLRLTKLNFNSAAFSAEDPVTLAFSNRVGEILYLLGEKSPAIGGGFYPRVEQAVSPVRLKWML